MKKKGLLIATIVMVLVLAVSLTTATYAWFTATSEVTVDTIQFNVNTAADLIIGLKDDNTVSTTSTAADYFSGTTTYTRGATFDKQGTWGGDYNSLGSNIDLNSLSFKNLTKAVGTGTFAGTAGSFDVDGDYTPGTATAGSADTSFNMANYLTGMIQANGQGASIDENSVDTAWKNVHYLDVVIGVQATKSNLDSMTCYVTINPTAGAILGMNTAIHVAYRVVAPGADSIGDLTDTDIYNDYHYSRTPGEVVNTVFNAAETAYNTAHPDAHSAGLVCIGGSSTTTLNPGAITVAIPIEDVDSGSIDITDIYQVQLVIFIAGYDEDCLEGAKGVGSDIIITFAGVETAA